jgi:hypothetical protein
MVIKWKEPVTRNQMRGPEPIFSGPRTNSKNKTKGIIGMDQGRRYWW